MLQACAKQRPCGCLNGLASVCNSQHSHRVPLFTEEVFPTSSSRRLPSLSQPLRCWYLDHFSPRCSEHLPVVRGAWVVNERGQRRNLLGSSEIKLGNQQGTSPVGPDLGPAVEAEVLWKIPSIAFRLGPCFLRNALGTKSPPC